MVLVLLVGPDLISQDLRFNAMPLYFSRPVRRLDYFAGQARRDRRFSRRGRDRAAGLLAYVLGVAFSLDPTVFRDTWRLLAGSLAFGLIVVLSAGTLMLAISSLSRNSRFVGAMWMGLWVVSDVDRRCARADRSTRDWCPLVSYTTNLDRVRDALLDATRPARTSSWTLWEAGPRPRGRGRSRPHPFAVGAAGSPPIRLPTR